MWYLIEYGFMLLVIVLFLTEIVIPMFAGTPYFSTFRKKAPIAETSTLDAKLKNAKEKVEEVKVIQSEVSAHFKTAEQLKEESDNLLNNNKL